MTFEELKESLQTEREFRNSDDWTFQAVAADCLAYHYQTYGGLGR